MNIHASLFPAAALRRAFFREKASKVVFFNVQFTENVCFTMESLCLLNYNEYMGVWDFFG